MFRLEWEEKIAGMNFLEEARKLALKATCSRSRCGSVIVRDWEIVWVGFNSPSYGLESQRRCHFEKSEYHKKVTDKTCCIHAEQRAIMDGLARNPQKLTGSRLYFVRVGDDGNIKNSGEPYCTICSKMSLDSWISEFVLVQKDWICVYETWEYNDLSYKYTE
ncbi:MAG: hypothetical protein ACD_2C00001G0013 [uncultured bacterium (gcode 4)]|uniref:CMP/dCMP-type deaminase domain-containing protein n=1 Tax=uncultured bacterium (gcode 4) TaxID=1234023 RepID=K2G519_9BACT|nr:MAG: hypothetical protein ACD_2C00001G0013 [uncultured bacterium (gcode 4)]